jgi:hypothetical protein
MLIVDRDRNLQMPLTQLSKRIEADKSLALEAGGGAFLSSENSEETAPRVAVESRRRARLSLFESGEGDVVN